ncbi:MAG: AAA family ATPase [Jatrophihabitantaceae bacterium]
MGPNRQVGVEHRLIGGTEPSLPLLERERELEVLRAAVQAPGPDGSLVYVEGPAGIGKTTLLQAGVSLARNRGWRVVQARCAEIEQEFAYGAVRQLLDPVVREDRAQPFLAHADASSPFQVLNAYYWQLADLTRDSPVLVVVDDAQWCDTASLRFLGFLVRRLDGLPLTLVVAAREADQPGPRQLLDDLVGQFHVSPMRPAPLSETAVRRLLSHRSGHPPPVELVTACLDVTARNPLVLRELVGLLADVEIGPDTAGWVRQVTGPQVIARQVEQQLARQGPAVRELARALAVLGEQTSLRAAARMSGLDESAASEGADRLVRLGLATRNPALTFAHPLIQSAVHAGLDENQLGQAHERAAEVLAEFGAPLEQQASHHMLCRRSADGRRVELLLAAAQQARRRGSPDSAAAYLRRALDEPAPPALESEIGRQLANCEAYTLRFDDAVGHLERAVEMAGDAHQWALSSYSLARVLEASGRAREALAAVQSASDRLGPQDTSRLHARVDCEVLGYSRVVLGQQAGYDTTVERLDHYPDDAWAQLAAVRAAHRAFTLAGTGGSAENVIVHAERAFRGDLLSPDLAALYFAATALMCADRFDLVRTALGHAVAKSIDGGVTVGVSVGRAYLAEAALWGGDLAEVAAQIDLARQEPLISVNVAAEFAAHEAEVAIERGELAGAARVLNTLPVQHRGRGTCHELGLRFVQARLHLANGEPALALPILLGLRERYDAWGLPVLLDRPWRSEAALAAARLGEVDQANSLAEEELDLARRFGAARALGRALRVAAAVGPASSRISLAREAVHALEHSHARLELARAHAELGRWLAAIGERSTGRDHLRRGYTIATECGANTLADGLQARLGQSGGRPPRTAVSGPAALTPAERRIAPLAAQDLTNREIATRLYVSEKTVEAHLSRVYRKLGVASRHELARYLRTTDIAE